MTLLLLAACALKIDYPDEYLGWAMVSDVAMFFFGLVIVTTIYGGPK